MAQTHISLCGYNLYGKLQCFGLCFIILMETVFIFFYQCCNMAIHVYLLLAIQHVQVLYNMTLYLFVCSSCASLMRPLSQWTNYIRHITSVCLVFCMHMYSFACLIRRTPPPIICDTAITACQSDTNFSSSELTGCRYPGLLDWKIVLTCCRWESIPWFPAWTANTLFTRPGAVSFVIGE